VAKGREVIEAAPQLELRDYQKWAVHLFLEALKSGHRRVVLVCPTGSGKRVMAIWVCQYATENNRRVLFLTNRRLLVQQMFEGAGSYGVAHGVIMASTDPGDIGAPIQIASLQTIESWYTRPGLGAMQGTGLPQADLIIIDEGHADAERYDTLLAFYPNAKVLVLTATPVGTEGKALVPKPYDVMIEGCLNSELIAQGLLLPTVVYAPSEPNIQGVKIVKRQEYNQSQLGRAVKECTVFADVFAEWDRYRDRATVCFVPGVDYGRDLERQFNFLGAKFHLIHAKTTHADRERFIQEVEQGAANGLISVDVLKEGFDLPRLSCCVDLQPNTQLRSYWQKIGRVKRAYPGQTDARLLDFAGNYWKFPHPDTDPEWPSGEESTQEAIERRRKDGKERQPIMCPKCSFVRQFGPKCPQCGHQADGEPTRRIRMGNGKLKEIPAHAKAKREKSAAEKSLDSWKGSLFMGLRGGMTFHQCAVIHRNKTGHWPQEGFPGTYPDGSLAWKRKVGDVLNPQSLMVQCNRYLEKKNGT
jgi:DNA repair protein RadD